MQANSTAAAAAAAAEQEMQILGSSMDTAMLRVMIAA
jgi:hypothetical protein